MGQAIDLARSVNFLSAPNPQVGCVLVGDDNTVLGRGSTQKAGGPHAEIMAIADAQNNGRCIAGATAYVTLEPCSHTGRTGPCCDALIAAGIKKVVASIADPNPLVAGHGFARLRAAGVEVVIGPGSAASRELNIGFFSRMIRKRPWVRSKIAASLDGKTALNNGASQWITSPEARLDGHRWRAQSCALLTGTGTVLRDDPRLDVRDIESTRQPSLIVIDSLLQTPPNARIFEAARAVYIYTCTKNAQKERELLKRGAQVFHLPATNDRVNLHAVLHDLASREINELHVEAGARLNGALMNENLIDELLIYLAPKLIGQGHDMSTFGPIDDLHCAPTLDMRSVDRVGNDLRIVARIVGHEFF